MNSRHLTTRTSVEATARIAFSTLAAAAIAGSLYASGTDTAQTMVRTDSPATRNGWQAQSLITIGESFNGYTPVGIPDGMGAYALDADTVRVLVVHELGRSAGYDYTLANGTPLKGARMSFFDVKKTTRQLEAAGLAYGTVYDRGGNEVISAAQVNEYGNAINGFSRFCSAQLVKAGQYGFTDTVFLTGEETGVPDHPHGGTFWALDVATNSLWAVPALGRGAWENAAAFDSGSPDHVALLLGDDEEQAPLYLYIGQKNAAGDGSFLDRNGLKVGQLYAWVASNGDTTPEQFNAGNGLGLSRSGSFIPVSVIEPSMAGMPGYDGAGYLNDNTLRGSAQSQGAFRFSRPEDLHTNPANASQLVLASTGRGSVFPSDNWGDLLVIDMDLSNLTQPKATVRILHDADALPVADQGVRSPDNLCWAADGFIYVQEDKSTSPGSLFGQATGIEASIWKVNPVSGEFSRIAEVDRTAVPAGQSDPVPNDVGNWETSGVIDVSALFGVAPRETLLLCNVQAHSLTGGTIGGSASLVQGGQLLFLTNGRRVIRLQQGQ